MLSRATKTVTSAPCALRLLRYWLRYATTVTPASSAASSATKSVPLLVETNRCASSIFFSFSCLARHDGETRGDRLAFTDFGSGALRIRRCVLDEVAPDRALLHGEVRARVAAAGRPGPARDAEGREVRRRHIGRPAASERREVGDQELDEPDVAGRIGGPVVRRAACEAIVHPGESRACHRPGLGRNAVGRTGRRRGIRAVTDRV